MGCNESIVPGFDASKVSNLEIALEDPGRPSWIIAHLDGTLDTYNSPEFIHKMDLLVAAGFRNLVIDMRDVSYVSSTGIGAFTHVLRALRPLQGDVSIAGLQPNVLEIFRLLGFSNFFSIRESVADALQGAQEEAQSQETATAFPSVVSCPICARRLKVPRPGRFRCSECRAVLNIDAARGVAAG